MTGDPVPPTFHISDAASGQVLKVLGEAVIATDPQGTILLWNQAAEALYGYSEKEALGRSIYDITVPQISESDARQIMTRLSSGQNWSGEFQVRNRDGGMFIVEVTDVPVADSQGVLKFIVGLSRDISHRLEVEQERDRLDQEKEAISHSRSQFLTLISHELRTPLTAILGFSEMLTRDDRVLDDAAIKESLFDIRDAARQMRRLVEDLLAISRSSLSSMDRAAILEPVVVGRILDTVVEEHRQQHPTRKVKLVSPPEVPRVLAHPMYLEHVLINLLSNAERYSPATETIEIMVEPSASLVAIDLMDRAGLSQSAGWQGLISSPGQASQGSGTEFSICHSLIEIQNGSFSRESREGGGSVYRITLPASP